MLEFNSKALILGRIVESLFQRELKQGNRSKIEELQGQVDKHVEEKAAWEKEREEWLEEKKRFDVNKDVVDGQLISEVKTSPEEEARKMGVDGDMNVGEAVTVEGLKTEPLFFLARAAAFLLCKFRRPRASCHHANASLLPPPREPPREPPPATAVSSRLQPPPREPPHEPPPATAAVSSRLQPPPREPPREPPPATAAVSSRLQPPPRETTTRALAPSRLASVHHHARLLPLSRPSLCLSASVPASLYHHANTFVLLPQLSRRDFL
ncbi:uncharacterized protein LOC114194878 [Vigna unguiculata]|uniref:uncharacterized protein LOC114194878 n=1 Tax=Vigna unguiculata TaxID=3917 RepID=UPI0010167BD4|nr:uncharacterized protein LOC114194878 [Vigna unguiculata]